MSSFSVSYQYRGRMPKFQMVTVKGKIAMTVNLKGWKSAGSLLLFFYAIVQVKTTGGKY